MVSALSFGKRARVARKNTVVSAPVCPPYDPSQQERPDSVLLFLASAIPLNENSAHPFMGFHSVFMVPLPKCQPIKNDVKRKDII
jgi:hypothetical protein